MKPYLVLAVLAAFSVSGCSWSPGSLAFGIGGHYNNARMEFIGKNGNFDKAVSELEYVVSKDPFYKDSLTRLGRAYYHKGRYQDAFKMLKRALAVNPKDDIAWIALGLTQLRLGDDERGLESIKGGITIMAKAQRDGYRGADPLFWDSNGVIRRSIRRAGFYATKGLEEKHKLMRSSELLLYRIDNGLWESRGDKELDETTETP